MLGIKLIIQSMMFGTAAILDQGSNCAARGRLCPFFPLAPRSVWGQPVSDLPSTLTSRIVQTRSSSFGRTTVAGVPCPDTMSPFPSPHVLISNSILPEDPFSLTYGRMRISATCKLCY